MDAQVVIELGSEEYDRALTLTALPVNVRTVEIRQAGGLLSEHRRVILVEGIAPMTRQQHGVDDAPAALLHIRPTEEVRQ